MQTILTLLLALAASTTANYKIEEIKGNVLIEEEAKVHLYHETWLLITGMNFTTNNKRIRTIDETIQLVETACNKKYTPQYEIQLIKSRLERLKYKNNILKKLLGRQERNKRGLANFIGDISKKLFGTLSESDLNQVNIEFDNLYKDNNNFTEKTVQLFDLYRYIVSRPMRYR